jgi:alpha-D-ribose 1-methylphosphonate 5-triphosphate synthase subunit PhnL
MKRIIQVEGLSKSFVLHHLGKHIRGCHHINFILEEGEFLGITGKSGAGKSTVMKCIYRTYLPNGGHIWYHSRLYGLIDLVRATEREVMHLRKKEVGYVSQFLNVLPRTTAREIVELALLEMGHDRMGASREAERMLEHFELDKELWDLYPHTFSGGEKLRLNMARAMVKKPRLLLLDEPTASLDNASKIRVKELLLKLKKEGTSMLGIFHDLEFMEGVCDRVINMQAGTFLLEPCLEVNP